MPKNVPIKEDLQNVIIVERKDIFLKIALKINNKKIEVVTTVEKKDIKLLIAVSLGKKEEEEAEDEADLIEDEALEEDLERKDKEQEIECLNL